MMTDFTKLASDYQRYFGALQQEPTKSIDRDTLQWLAKTAAREYLNNKVSLNDSILKIAEKEKDLNIDHLKRISEMANNEVFEQLFNNSTDKNVHFDVADTDFITSKVAGRSVEADYDLSSYNIAPNKILEKIASSDNEKRHTPSNKELDGRVRWGRAGEEIGNTLGLLKGVQSGYNWGKNSPSLGGGALGKTVGVLGGAYLGSSLGRFVGGVTGENAHSAYSKHVSRKDRDGAMYSEDEDSPMKKLAWHEDPRKDLYDLKEKLQAAKEELETEKLATSHNMKVAYDDLFKAVKSQLKESTFSKIAQAMHAVSNDDSDLNVLEDISYDLMKQRAASIDQLNISSGNNSTVAVNKEHPIVSNFTEYTKLAHYKNQIDIAITEIDDSLVKTSAAITKMNKRN